MQQKVLINSAQGKCHLPEDEKPLLCLAGGTGLAPIKAILEQAVLNDDSREIILYWSVKNNKGIFLPDQLQTFASKLKIFPA